MSDQRPTPPRGYLYADQIMHGMVYPNGLTVRAAEGCQDSYMRVTRSDGSARFYEKDDLVKIQPRKKIWRRTVTQTTTYETDDPEIADAWSQCGARDMELYVDQRSVTSSTGYNAGNTHATYR